MVAQKGTKFVAAHLEKLSVFLDSVKLSRLERYSSLLEGLQLDEQGCLLSTRKWPYLVIGTQKSSQANTRWWSNLVADLRRLILPLTCMPPWFQEPHWDASGVPFACVELCQTEEALTAFSLLLLLSMIYTPPNDKQNQIEITIKNITQMPFFIIYFSNFHSYLFLKLQQQLISRN